MAADEDLQHLKELLDIYRERRRDLDKKVAIHGRGHLPSDTALEIREVDESIARLQARMLALTVPQEVQDATGPEASVDVLRHEVKNIRDKIDHLYRWIERELIEMREESRQWRNVQEQKHDEGARFYRLSLGVLAGGVLLALLLIAAIIGGRLF